LSVAFAADLEFDYVARALLLANSIQVPTVEIFVG